MSGKSLQKQGISDIGLLVFLSSVKHVQQYLQSSNNLAPSFYTSWINLITSELLPKWTLFQLCLFGLSFHQQHMNLHRNLTETEGNQWLKIPITREEIARRRRFLEVRWSHIKLLNYARRNTQKSLKIYYCLNSNRCRCVKKLKIPATISCCCYCDELRWDRAFI